MNREAKEAYLPDNRRESWPHTNDSVCVRQGSHETATSVKVLFFIFILFLKPQYHPLTFHLNEHYPQQCLRAAGNISWPLAALMCHVRLDVWEVPIHPPQWSLHHRIDAAIYSLCTILLNNRCCCSDHFASYALIRRSSVFFSPKFFPQTLVFKHLQHRTLVSSTQQWRPCHQLTKIKRCMTSRRATKIVSVNIITQDMMWKVVMWQA